MNFTIYEDYQEDFVHLLDICQDQDRLNSIICTGAPYTYTTTHRNKNVNGG